MFRVSKMSTRRLRRRNLDACVRHTTSIVDARRRFRCCEQRLLRHSRVLRAEEAQFPAHEGLFHPAVLLAALQPADSKNDAPNLIDVAEAGQLEARR